MKPSNLCFCCAINSVGLTLFKEASSLCLRFCVDGPAGRHIINLWLCVCQPRPPSPTQTALLPGNCSAVAGNKMAKGEQGDANVTLVIFSGLIKKKKKKVEHTTTHFHFCFKPRPPQIAAWAALRGREATKRRYFP